jgi:hypothetical protein
MLGEINIKITGRGTVKAPEITTQEGDNAADRECSADSADASAC